MLPSLANGNVTTRVRSVWNDKTMRSHIRRTWSFISLGTPAGVAMSGLATGLRVAASLRILSMRVSTSRTAVRYSSSLRWSLPPSCFVSALASSATKSSTLLARASRLARTAAVSLESVPPKSRSKTSLGSVSLAFGVASPRHDRFDE